MNQPALHLVIGNKRYSSWSLRPWLLLTHFDIPFSETVIGLDLSDTTAKISQWSPSGRVPALRIENQTIGESLAICETLADFYPEKQMWPTDRLQRAWARSVSNEMHAGFETLRRNLPMKCIEQFKNFNYSVAQSDVDRIQALWTECLEAHLREGPYLFGKFSIADAMYAPVIFRFHSYGVKVSKNCEGYFRRMLEHPGMQKWLLEARAEELRMKRYDVAQN